MKKKKKKSSGTQITLAIIFGGVDLLMVLLLVFALIYSPKSGESVKASLPEGFEENADTYYDYNEQEYDSAAVLDYSSGKGVRQKVTADPTVSAQNEENEDPYSGFVFPDSDSVYLTDADIREKVTNADTCRRAINEIYARYGYAFTKQENIDLFNQYSWYKNMPKETDMSAVSRQFSSAERANVEKLQAYEDSKGWS